MTGVRHAWTFDDMFSVFATQGIDSKVKDQFTREELHPLAQTNVESLKDFDYFTYAKADGAKVEFAEPAADYYLDWTKETVLTLHFTLPFKTPVKTKDLSSKSSTRPTSSISPLCQENPLRWSVRRRLQARRRRPAR